MRAVESGIRAHTLLTPGFERAGHRTAATGSIELLEIRSYFHAWERDRGYPDCCAGGPVAVQAFDLMR